MDIFRGSNALDGNNVVRQMVMRSCSASRISVVQRAKMLMDELCNKGSLDQCLVSAFRDLLALQGYPECFWNISQELVKDIGAIP